MEIINSLDWKLPKINERINEIKEAYDLNITELTEKIQALQSIKCDKKEV